MVLEEVNGEPALLLRVGDRLETVFVLSVHDDRIAALRVCAIPTNSDISSGSSPISDVRSGSGPEVARDRCALAGPAHRTSKTPRCRNARAGRAGTSTRPSTTGRTRGRSAAATCRSGSGWLRTCAGRCSSSDAAPDGSRCRSRAPARTGRHRPVGADARARADMRRKRARHAPGAAASAVARARRHPPPAVRRRPLRVRASPPYGILQSLLSRTRPDRDASNRPRAC